VPKKADGTGEDIYSILEGDFLVSVAGGHAYSGPLPGFYGFVAVSREFLPRRAGKPAPFAPIDPAARLIPMRFQSLPRTDAGGGERGSRGSIARGAGSGTQVYQNRFAVELQFARTSLAYKGEVLLRGGFEALVVSGVK
jgi:hypothetical protein